MYKKEKGEKDVAKEKKKGEEKKLYLGVFIYAAYYYCDFSVVVDN